MFFIPCFSHTSGSFLNCITVREGIAETRKVERDLENIVVTYLGPSKNFRFFSTYFCLNSLKGRYMKVNV